MLAGIFSLALSSVLLLCGAGSVPIENLLPQGAMQGDLNAGGHNLTNAATVSATNVIVSGTLTAPNLATVATSGAYGDLSGLPTLGALAALSPSGTASSSTYLRGDNTWATVSGGSGTVTSVAMAMPGAIFNTSVTGSPITGTGTFTPTLIAQPHNTVLAGPVSTGSATPTFRVLVSADIPNNGANTTGTATYAGTVTNTSQNIATLSNLTTDGVVYTSGGGGTLNTGWTLAPDDSASSATAVSLTGGNYTGSGSANPGGAVSITGGATSGTTSSSIGGALNLAGGVGLGTNSTGGALNIISGAGNGTGLSGSLNMDLGAGSGGAVINIGTQRAETIKIGSSSFSGVTSLNAKTINILGTTAIGNATAGYIGEFVNSLIASGSAVSLTTATPANITSISLTAGDWDVEGSVNFSGTSATTSQFEGGISTGSATFPTDGSEVYSYAPMTTTTAIDSVAAIRKRINVSSTTTVYLVGSVTFSAGTEAGYGTVNARRVR